MNGAPRSWRSAVSQRQLQSISLCEGDWWMQWMVSLPAHGLALPSLIKRFLNQWMEWAAGEEKNPIKSNSSFIYENEVWLIGFSSFISLPFSLEWKDKFNWNGGGLGSSPAGIPLNYLWMEVWARLLLPCGAGPTSSAAAKSFSLLFKEKRNNLPFGNGRQPGSLFAPFKFKN